jgi:UDP-glucuronate 4-epimerase
MAKTYLVTGGAGFIGSQTAKRLAERGDKVVVVDDFNSGLYTSQLKRDRVTHLLEPHNIPVIELDIRDAAALDKVFAEHAIDHICHLGAWAGVGMSLKVPETYETVNITGTRHIFDMAVKYKIPHVAYASSSSVYGANTKQPFSENDRVDMPLAPYALSKRVNELQAFYYHQLYGLKSSGLRFFTVYGPWGRPDMALFIFTDKILNGEPISMNHPNTTRRDFTFVDDIISGVIASMDKPYEYEIFNLGGNSTVELSHFVDVIEDTIGKKAIRQYRELPPGDVPETVADVSKAQKMLGYDPQTRVEQGIPKFWEWYKEYYHVN